VIKKKLMGGNDDPAAANGMPYSHSPRSLRALNSDTALTEEKAAAANGMCSSILLQ